MIMSQLMKFRLPSFPNPLEMRSSLQGYLENNGTFTVGTYSGTGEAGLILLGNIDQEIMDEYQFMFETCLVFSELTVLC